MQEYRIKQLERSYNKIIVPDRQLKEIKSKFWELSQKWLKLLIDYLNWDKYLIVQAMAKTINKDNYTDTISYLDWALSRDDWLIITLSEYIKKQNERNIDK